MEQLCKVTKIIAYINLGIFLPSFPAPRTIKQEKKKEEVAKC